MGDALRMPSQPLQPRLRFPWLLQVQRRAPLPAEESICITFNPKIFLFVAKNYKRLRWEDKNRANIGADHKKPWKCWCGTSGSSINLIAATNFSSENSSTGIGGGPTPLAWTLSPQNGWSPKNGMMVVGHCNTNKS